jgi:UbiD family decarboxylase
MSFRGFIKVLKNAAFLKEVHESISPNLEVAARSMDSGPILFHNVEGKKVCLNILCNRDLLALAMKIKSGSIIPYLISRDYMGQVKEVDYSPFQEVVSEPDLSRFPILTPRRWLSLNMKVT